MLRVGSWALPSLASVFAGHQEGQFSPLPGCKIKIRFKTHQNPTIELQTIRKFLGRCKPRCTCYSYYKCELTGVGGWAPLPLWLPPATVCSGPRGVDSATLLAAKLKYDQNAPKNRLFYSKMSEIFGREAGPMHPSALRYAHPFLVAFRHSTPRAHF